MKDTMKRLLSIMLAMLMLTSVADFAALIPAKAEETLGGSRVGAAPDTLLTMGEWLYWVEDDQAIVAGYTNTEQRKLTVPYNLGGYPVTAIGHKAFSQNAALENIQMHTNITVIASDAFEGLDDTVIEAYHGAYALKYAQKRGMEQVCLSEMGGLADSVLDMAGVYDKAYTNLTAENVVFTAKQATFLKQGQVLYFPPTKEFPTGLARQVSGISAYGDKLNVSLACIELDLAFDYFEGSADLYLDWDNAVYADCVTEVRDISAENSYENSLPGIGYSKEFSINFKLGEHWSLEGAMKVDASVSANYKISKIKKKWTMESASVALTTATEGTLALQCNGKAPGITETLYYAKGKKGTLARVPFFSVYGFNGFLTLEYICEVNGKVEIKLAHTAFQSYTLTNGKWIPDSRNGEPVFQSMVEGSVKIGPELALELTVGIAELAELVFFKAAISLYGEGKGSLTKTSVWGDSKWFVCADVSVDLYFEVKVQVGIVKLNTFIGSIEVEKSACYTFPSNGKGKIKLRSLLHKHYDQVSRGEIYNIPFSTLKETNTCRMLGKPIEYDTGFSCIRLFSDVNGFVARPADPVRKGYKFLGWYLDADRSGLPGGDYKFDFSNRNMPYLADGKVLHMYAKWHDLYPVTSFQLDKTSIIGYSNVSETHKITPVSILPANANNKGMTWSTSDSSVASVDAYGNVTFNNAGIATITCTSVSNPSVSRTCHVLVQQSALGVQLSQNSIFRYSDNMSPVQLTAAVLPDNAVDKAIVWTSDNPAVAEVSQDGLVTLKGLGTANIYCHNVRNPNAFGVCSVGVYQAVTDIELDRESHLRTNADMSDLKLNAAVYPHNAYNKTLRWVSSNPSVATVSASGVVSMKGLGKTTITCTSVSNPGITDTFELEIIQAVTDIELNENAVTVYSDHKEAIQLIPDVKPDNAGNKSVTWTSSNPDVVAVSESGAVTVVSAGSATVTCRSVSNPDVAAQCSFTILQAVTDITLNRNAINTTSDEINPFYLEAVVGPKNAYNKAVIWTSSNPDVASVTADGVVTVEGVGKATIICRSVSTPYIIDECVVTVAQAVTAMQLNKTSIYCGSNRQDNYQLIATLDAEEQANREVSWVSSNPAVAQVSDSGIVEIKGVGEAIITCTSVSNPGVSAKCSVTVRQSVTGISLNRESVECFSDETESFELIASVLPSDAASNVLHWVSSNPAVAAVSDEGVVTIAGPGNATITCTSVSDPEISDSCTVTVRQAVVSMHLNADEIVRYTYETDPIQLTAYVHPAYAYDKSVIWSSSNKDTAVVSETGLVEIKGAGETVIECVSVSRPEISAQCIVSTKQTVDSLSLNYENLELLTGDAPVQLTANVLPANAEDAELIWTSSNPETAAVSDSGLLNITGSGTAVITCTSVSNPDAEAVCNVTVSQAVLGLTLNETDIECFSDVSDPVYLTVNVQPVYAGDKSVAWSSSNENVASVSADGAITIAGTGETVITCRSVSNPDVMAQCTITVRQAMTGIALDQTDITMYSDDVSGMQLNAVILPENADEHDVIWQSDNMNVAVVSDTGLVQVAGNGSATITCSSVRNPEAVFAACTVTVRQPVDSVRVEGDTASLLPGETLHLSAECYPEYADNTVLTWSSDNEDAAVVDQNGCVTAVSYGTATITAAAADGRGASTSYIVNVEHELVLNTLVMNDSVYAQGAEHTTLASIGITGASARRLAEKGLEPVWTLTKQGETDDVEMEAISTSVEDRGQTYETTGVLLGGSHFETPGSHTYTVTCTAGSFSDSAEITVFVDGAAYAENVMLTPSTITMDIGDEIFLSNTLSSVDGKPLPSDLVLKSIAGDEYFGDHAAMTEAEDGWFVRFDESGIYTAELRYEAGNIAYKVNVSLYVKDENGIVRIRVEDIVLNKTSADLVQGESLALKAAVEPLDAYDTSVTWSSTDESVAVVDDKGLVTAVASGSAAIICQANDGSGNTAMCAVRVEKFLQLDDSQLEFTVYDSGEIHTGLGIVNVTMDSEERLVDAGLNVTWTLEKTGGNACEIALEEFRAVAEEGVTVSGNRIRLLRMNSAGSDEYVLICRAGEYTDSCIIRIHVAEFQLPEAITLPQTEYVCTVNEYVTVNTAYTGGELPEDTQLVIRGGNAFDYALSDEYDFTEREKLIFSAPGTYAADVIFYGSNYSYTCPITIAVRDKNGSLPVNITGISVVPDDMYLLVGDQMQLSAAVEPANASYGEMTWSSSNTNVVTVSAAGVATAIGAGEAYVTVSVPESDFMGGCYVMVEDGLTLQNTGVERTVFVDGTTRIHLDKVQLTNAASRRLDSAPEWSLTRVSGNNLTLRVQENNAIDSDGAVVYGCSIELYSMSREGTAEYELSCRMGDEEITIPVIVHAVSRDQNLPSALTFAEKVYNAGVNELLIINPEIICLPEGAVVPDGLRVELEGDALFTGAQNIEDFCVSQNMTTLTFNRAGLFEANFVYSYSNMRYVVPVTFRIADESGHVPVLASSMKLSSRSMWLVENETAELNAVFTPANAENRAVSWMSTNPSVATVDDEGRVTAIGKGEAIIICTPDDDLLSAQICSVCVEDALTIETAPEKISLFKQGAQKNEVFSALLSQGTIQRFARAGIIPQWELTRISGNHSEVEATVSAQNDSMIITSAELKSGGEDVYRITCTAGEYTGICEFALEVIDLGNIAQSIAAAQSSVHTEVGKTLSIDFTPVCYPVGSVMPQSDSMWSMYSPVGSDFYDAIDFGAYEENGDTVTVRFTRPGRYLLSRQFFLENLHYSQVCEINVGQSDKPLNLIQSNTSETVVYLGGTAGAVAEISLTDTILHDLYGDEITWSLTRLSGSSLTAALKDTASGVQLHAVSADAEGEDVWRVTCAFGEFEESVDIRVSVRKPRSTVPETVTLAADRINGMAGDWLSLPIAAACWPVGSALPETGDDFWRFDPIGAAADACKWTIEDGILRVCSLQSGYYSGMLRYEAGSFRYAMPVYMAITDEEGTLPVPPLQMTLSDRTEAVYLNGMTGIRIGAAQVSRSAGAYHAGEAAAYMAANKGEWSIRITSGTAASLSIVNDGTNAAGIVLDSVSHAGSICYEVRCEVSDTVYAASGTLEVLSETDENPDPVFGKNMFFAKPGELLKIPTELYERGSNIILQGQTKWNPGALLPAIGYEYTETADSLLVTFYKEGVYNTTVTATIGNLVYDIPITIVVGRESEQYDVLKLPAALRIIEAEAFMGTAAEIVDLRGTCIEQIGAGAFSKSDSLIIIYIPSTVKSIAENAFESSPNVTIICEENSAADAYAVRQKIAVRHE